MKPNKQGIEGLPLVTLAFAVIAAIVILWWASNYSHMFGIFVNLNRDALNDNFKLLNTELGKLIASQKGFVSSEMALRLSSVSAIVGFNPGKTVTYYTPGGNERLILHKPDAFCSTGACLCLYYNRDAWGGYSSRNKNVICQDYGDSTFFYSRYDNTDKNKGARLRLSQPIAGINDYETLVLDGQGFNTKALYLEVTEIKGMRYVYIAELDPHEEAVRAKP